MSELPWYKCFPRAVLDGMMGLTPEERGIYRTVIDLIYLRNGPVPDQASELANQCYTTVRTWTKVRAALILKGKLFEVNFNGVASLMNARCAEEIADRERLSESRSEAGRKGGSKPRSKPHKNNNLGQAIASDLPIKDEASANRLEIEDSSEEDKSSSGAAGAVVDLDKEGWERGVRLLRVRAEMTDRQARSFFGGVLKDHGLQARDLLPSVIKAEANGTLEPRAYLTAAAQAIKRQRAPPKKRVGFV